MDQTDEQLMQRYQNGDIEAFNIIYKRHRAKVFSYVAKRLFDKSVQEEVFQNIFLKFHRSRNSYNKKFQLIKWIYTICRSELYDYCKKKKIQTIPFDENISTHKLESKKLSLIDIDEYKSLTENEVSTLKLKYYSDLDYDEISKQLGLTKPNVRKIISRAIEKIKKRIDEKSVKST